ncbi:DJ-1 [Decorospora gaudefroyi]|uniref:D-lactate dehydratase n=1 Tax=Decorospora gaudefroyi TaxID=184978 RepID=A0A6A5KQ60_9PLEO|nr:DJ-1 [Decorospora gaudefroyi]
MPAALILVADGSEEIEFVTPYDVLTRAGFQVRSAGVNLQEPYAHMSRNLRILPDHPNLQAIPSQSAHENFDILILPGGAAGSKTFCDSPVVLDLICQFRTAGKWVAVICAATTALVAAGQQGKEGVKVTSHPSVADEIKKSVGWTYSEERIVVVPEAKVVTSRGPGTAMLFALTIVELLCGREKRDEVAAPMLVADTL